MVSHDKIGIREQSFADSAAHVLSLLQSLEREMRCLDLWSEDAPSDQRLASRMPFCYDTLSFPEWLQWVFIPKLQVIVRSRRTLPHKCDIAPFAEEWFRVQHLQQEARRLQSIIRELDRLLSVSWH